MVVSVRCWDPRADAEPEARYRNAGCREAVQDAKGGQVEYRVEKAGIIHAGVGKASFAEGDIAENICSLVDAVNKAKPPGAKGTYIKKISISSTMGPGIKLDIGPLLERAGQ